jgi:FkbM family methyltransferase
MTVSLKVPDAKLIEGWWIPKSDTHMQEIIHLIRKKKAKRNREKFNSEGHLQYQYRKLVKAMEFVPLNRRRIALDIGAHIGFWGRHLTRHFGYVHAFEPCEHLSRLWEYNVPGKNWTMYGCALGNKKCRATMKLGALGLSGSNHVFLDKAGDTLVERLDDFKLTEVDFIKIDVEGYEYEVVKGGYETIMSNKPVIVVEQKGQDSKWYRKDKDEASKFLLDLGYKVKAIESGDFIMVWDKN